MDMARASLEIGPWDVFVLDCTQTNLKWVALIDDIKRAYEFPCIFLTNSFWTPEEQARARTSGVLACLTKPFEIEELLVRVW